MKALRRAALMLMLLLLGLVAGGSSQNTPSPEDPVTAKHKSNIKTSLGAIADVLLPKVEEALQDVVDAALAGLNSTNITDVFPNVWNVVSECYEATKPFYQHLKKVFLNETKLNATLGIILADVDATFKVNFWEFRNTSYYEEVTKAVAEIDSKINIEKQSKQIYGHIPKLIDPHVYKLDSFFQSYDPDFSFDYSAAVIAKLEAIMEVIKDRELLKTPLTDIGFKDAMLALLAGLRGWQSVSEIVSVMEYEGYDGLYSGENINTHANSRFSYQDAWEFLHNYGANEQEFRIHVYFALHRFENFYNYWYEVVTRYWAQITMASRIMALIDAVDVFISHEASTFLIEQTAVKMHDFKAVLKNVTQVNTEPCPNTTHEEL